MKLQISSKCTSYSSSSARTEALLKSSSEIILWRLNMLLKESIDMENINTSIWFRWDKTKDKVQSRTYTCRNPKRHIPLVSLLL